MKNKNIVIIVVTVVIFLVLLVGVGVMYGHYSDEYFDSDAYKDTLSPDGDTVGDGAENKLPDTDSVPDTDAADLSLASDFTVYDNEGEPVKLSEKRGKPVIVNFWATWCGPCKNELPLFDAAYAQFGDEIEFMMVDLTDGYHDTPESVVAFIEENGYEFPVYHDLSQNAAVTYRISAVPLTLFIDRNGELYHSQLGQLNEDILAHYINELINN